MKTSRAPQLGRCWEAITTAHSMLLKLPPSPDRDDATARLGEAIMAAERAKSASQDQIRGEVAAEAAAQHLKWSGQDEETNDGRAWIRQYWIDAGFETSILDTPQNPQIPETAWSGVFVAAVVAAIALKRGFCEQLLGEGSTANHFWYAAIALRDRREYRYERYHAFQPKEVATRPGDIIISWRTTAWDWGDLAKASYSDQFSPRDGHGDIAVCVHDDHAISLGGNVGNTVAYSPSQTGYELGPGRHIRHERVVAILRLMLVPDWGIPR